MHIRQLRAFKAVMTEGSVTLAAVSLGVTQPAVSSLISNLEASLGFMLFKRHHGRLRPTAESLIFLEEATRLLDSYNRTVRAARDIRDLKHGSLRIAALPAVSANFMPKLIARFIRESPRVTVSLQTRTSPQIREWISTQQFDLGFAELPADDPAIEYDRLSLECLCAVPADHGLSTKDRITPKDLAGEPFIAQNPEHSAHYQLKSAFETAEVSWAPYIECHLFAPACRIAAEGGGFAIVDPFTANDFEGGSLVFRPFEPRIPYELGLMYPALRPRSRLVHDFSLEIKRALGDMLGE
jgi:DNA-binding transcriptional LysR family regulator